MIPLVQIITALWVALNGSKILQALGISSAPPISANNMGAIFTLSDHPAAVAAGSSAPTSPATPTPATTGPAAPPAPGSTPTGPTAKTLLQDVVRQPWVVWGGAALALGLTPLFAQFRAGAHEAAGGVRSVYDESQAVYRRVDRADDYVGNKSRRKVRR